MPEHTTQMGLKANARRYEPHVLGVISGYELAALVAHSERLPTITRLVGRLPRLARRALAVAAGVWLVKHFDDP